MGTVLEWSTDSKKGSFGSILCFYFILIITTNKYFSLKLSEQRLKYVSAYFCSVWFSFFTFAESVIGVPIKFQEQIQSEPKATVRFQK